MIGNLNLFKPHSKEEGNYQEWVQSSATPDPGQHMGDKTQENIIHERAKRSVLSQQVPTRLLGTFKAV